MEGCRGGLDRTEGEASPRMFPELVNLLTSTFNGQNLKSVDFIFSPFFFAH